MFDVKKAPKMAEPLSLISFELPLALQKTNNEEQFFVHQFGLRGENQFILFTTLTNLDLLSVSDDWFCDGTFSTALIV